jgi:hypothetical protein
MRMLVIISALFLLLNACAIDDNELRVQSISFHGSGGVKDTAEFDVQDNGFLTIYHSNVRFSATLDSIDISLSVQGNTIQISEIPYYYICPPHSYCMQHSQEYDLVYTIGPLARKTYFIIIGNQPGYVVNIPFAPVKYRK